MANKRIINLDDWVDMVAGDLKKLTLEDLQSQIRHRRPDKILLYAERRGDKYYGMVMIPKKYFNKYKCKCEETADGEIVV